MQQRDPAVRACGCGEVRGGKVIPKHKAIAALLLLATLCGCKHLAPKQVEYTERHPTLNTIIIYSADTARCGSSPCTNGSRVYEIPATTLTEKQFYFLRDFCSQHSIQCTTSGQMMMMSPSLHSDENGNFTANGGLSCKQVPNPGYAVFLECHF